MNQVQVKYRTEIVPLCVEMEALLGDSFPFLESFLYTLKSNPVGLLKQLTTCTRKKNLVSGVLELADLNIDELPINKSVYFYLKRMQLRGRPLILVSRGSSPLVQYVYKKLKIFDDVFTIANQDIYVSNIRVLKEQYGEKSFDYLGHFTSRHDDWDAVRNYILVDKVPEHYAWIKSNVRILKTFVPKTFDPSKIIQGLRPQQWVKNILIFFPLFFASSLSFQNISSLLLCFLGFSLLASCVYLLNDLLDLKDDRLHIDKKHRPLASGAVPITVGLLLLPLILFLALTILISIPEHSTFLLGAAFYYLIGNLFYNLLLKKIAYLDVFLLSSFYLIRLQCGFVILGLTIDPYLTLSCYLGATSLAMGKRASELFYRKQSHLETVKFGRGYNVSDLQFVTLSGFTLSMLSIFSLFQFLMQSSEDLPPAVGFLALLWMVRFWSETYQGKTDLDPVKYAIKDPFGWLIAFLTVGAVVIYKFIL